jgi:hypothetical protein
MAKNLALIAVFAVILAATAVASGNCATLRPGQNGGPVTKFVARDGMADNVTLFVSMHPAIGEPFTVIAVRPTEGVNARVESLIIRMYSGDRLLGARTTNSTGETVFNITRAGYYLFTGGDANFTVDLCGENATDASCKAAEPTGPADAPPNMTDSVRNASAAGNSTSAGAADLGNASAGSPSAGQQAAEPPKQGGKPPEGMPAYLFIIPAAVIIAAAFVLKGRDAKKGGFKRKGLT